MTITRKLNNDNGLQDWKTKRQPIINSNMSGRHDPASIELFYLPSYLPEKNPDEYLNCDLKYGISDMPSHGNEEQLKDNVQNHMLLLQADQKRVKKYFNHKDIKYAV